MRWLRKLFGDTLAKTTMRRTASAMLDALVTEIIEREGGAAFTWDKEGGDPPTKFGITIKTLSAWKMRNALREGKKWAKATVEEVRNLDEKTAREIYRTRYIDGPGFVSLDPPLRYCVVDYGVNCGTGTAARALQVAVNKTLGRVEGHRKARRIKIDGKCGPKTREAAARAFDGDPFGLIDEITSLRIARYWKIVESDKRKKKYINGWAGRAHAVAARCIDMIPGKAPNTFDTCQNGKAKAK